MSPNAGKSSSEVYEFGLYRIDAQREILFRGDEPVPLTPKTFQILLVLVRHSQEVVTKDDLLKAVWPDTFVEESNLSRNIFMLRKALGESPQDHRYIVTVPGRGYRFAENVRSIPEQDVSIVAAHHATVQLEVNQTGPWGQIFGRRPLRASIVAMAGILILAGAVLAFRLSFGRPATLTNKDTLVLSDFANFTGEAVFDETLRQGLAVELEQSPFLSLISDQRIRQTLGLMRQSPDTRLTSDVAREICERTGSAAVLEGSIANLGTQYVLGLRAKSCHTGDIVDEEQIQVAKKEDILNALSKIATQFRTRIGESLPMIEDHSTPLPQATTPSLEALKAFTTSINANRATGFNSAVPHLMRAIAIDPQFALAYGNLGLMYSNMGEAERAAECTRKAYELRDRVSEREKFWIEFLYDRQVTGNLKRGQQTLESWAQTYPRDFQPLSFLAGRVTESSGEYEKGIEAASRDLELNPDDVFGYDALAFQDLHLGRLGEVDRTLHRAAVRKLDNPDFLGIRFLVAFLRGDQAGMLRELNLARGKRGAEDLLTHYQALVLAYSGHVRQAEVVWQRAVGLAQENGDREKAGMYEAAEAVCQALFGNAAAARRLALAALDLGKGRDVEYGAAFALEVSGDFSRASELADHLEKRFPEDTSVQFSYLPTLRAVFALGHNEPSLALEKLQPAIRYDLAFPGTAFFAKFGVLYSAYCRGEAYLAAQQAREAAGEFRKILDHSSLVGADPVGALAHLQLGRALALAGNKDKAKSAYEHFFALWKDADKDTPVLMQAKAEYIKLQ